MDDDNPWGSEPDWAREDDDDPNRVGYEASGDDWNDEDGTVFAAQHILVLIDCNPSMFVPCVTVKNEEEDEDDDGYNSDGAGETDLLLDDVKVGDGGENDDAVATSPPIESPSRKKKATTSLVTPFDAALTATEKLLRLRVNNVATSRSGKRDGVGVMLYGTRRRSRAARRRESVERLPTGGTEDHYGARREASVESLPTGETEDQLPTGGTEDYRYVKKEHFSETEDDDDDYGSEDGDGEDEVEVSAFSGSTYELVPIVPPGIEQVLSVRGCLPDADRGGRFAERKRDLEAEFAVRTGNNGEEGPSDIARRMGHMSLCPLRSALHDASKSFLNAKCVKKNAATSKNPADAKTVWIFTNEDDPCHGNDEERKQVVIVAKDAVENGLEINVWPLPKPNASDDATPAVAFNRQVFFDFITTRDNTDRSDSIVRESMAGGVFFLDEMLENVRQQWKKIRRALSLPLLLPGWKEKPDDPGIMVDFFSTVSVRRKPTPVAVHQATNKVTVKTSELVALDSGDIIGPERIRTFAEFGGERVPISREEVSLIKKQSNSNGSYASLILIGFKPINSIPLTHTLDKPWFIYPNDDVVRGSRAAFAALHASMVRKRVLGIGELLTRVNGTPRLVAIVPQEEERETIGNVDDDARPALSKQVVPPGCIVLPLPYEDDVRAVEDDRGYRADEATVEAAMNLIRYQKMDGIEFGYSFDNPALTKFWNYIESVALGTPLPEDDNETDETKMDVDSILRSAARQIEALKLCLPEDEEESKTGSRKRKAIKMEADGSGVDWLHLYETDSLSDCTADTLKKYLRSVGARLGGKKAELVDRVKEIMKDRVEIGELKPTAPRSPECRTHVKQEHDDL